MDYFGYSVALSDSNALVGAYGVGPNANSGAAYLYNLTSNTPVLSLSDPESAPEVEFGYSVALNDNYVLVGAPGAEEGTPGSRTSQGAAYLYNLTSATPVLTYSDPGATTGDSFGTSVALDGTSVLVGAPGTNNAEGAAYLYTLTSNAPVLTYNDPGATSNDHFGDSVALSDNNALVGAFGTNNDEGAAYLYSLTGNVPVQTYSDPGATINDDFGKSVALSDNYVLVGAPGTSSAEGAAYLGVLGGLLGGGNPYTDATISTATLEQLLASGNVVLEADNDLKLDTDSDLVSNSANSLTLEAGRSIILDSSITLGGDLTLVANDSAADGVVAADRDAGTARIMMADGTSIDVGNASVSISLLGSDGSGASGGIQVGAISGGKITIVDGSTTGNVTLNGVLTASGTGTAITVVSGHNFINNVGASVLNATAGNWQVWSTNPAHAINDGLTPDFIQYGAVYGVTPVLGTGNGFFYSYASTGTGNPGGPGSGSQSSTGGSPSSAALFGPFSAFSIFSAQNNEDANFPSFFTQSQFSLSNTDWDGWYTPVFSSAKEPHPVYSNRSPQGEAGEKHPGKFPGQVIAFGSSLTVGGN